MKLLLAFILFFANPLSCELPKDKGWQQFFGRDTGNLQRSPIYRACVPKLWKRIDSEESVIDTMKPICEFLIESKSNETIKITIHNFPTTSIDERIPPIAQVNRWKQQLNVLSPLNFTVTPICKSGFVGLFFQARAHPNGVLAWSMQLAEEHYRHVNALSKASTNAAYYRQMGADYTIKAVGPNRLLEENKEDITHFATSFELIEAIPRND